MKIACVQFKPERGAVAQNLAHMERLCPDGCDIVIFPELATCGYLFEDRQKLAAASFSRKSDEMDAITMMARKNDCHIVFGFAESCGANIYNAAALVGPEGLLHVYRKLHLFDREQFVFDPGHEELKVVEARDVTIGIMICFDWVFPEAMRSLALLGADLICHPSNLVLDYCQDAMITRCLENRVFAATCNRIGTECVNDVSLRFTGKSQIVSPKGERLVQAADTDETVIVAEIDPHDAKDKWMTPRNHLFEQRRLTKYTLGDVCGHGDARGYRDNIAIIVRDEKGRVLAGERSDLPGVWQIPQGGVEPGEDSVTAMLRELEEEIGTNEVRILARSPLRYAYDFPTWLSYTPIAKQYRGQSQEYFVVCLEPGAEPDAKKADGEFQCFRWMEPKELLAQIVDFKQDAYTQAFSDLSHWLDYDMDSSTD